MTHTVFVFGTLKRGRGNNRLLDTAICWGKAQTVGRYVMAEHSPQVFDPTDTGVDVPPNALGHVIGEVYECDDATLARLDNLEQHPRWYVRKQVQVQSVGGGPMVTAWLYFMPWDQGSDTLRPAREDFTHEWGK